MSNNPSLPELLGAVRAWLAETFPGRTPKRLIIVTLEDDEPISLPVPTAMGLVKQAGDARPPAGSPRHSPDFRSVHWQGQDYIFTPTQAAVVRLLWEAWEDGNGEVGQETLLEKAGSEAKRLRDLFKDHPAWGNVIKSCGKGIFSLTA